MLIFLDYIPIVAFIAAYAATSDFFVATAVIMVAMPIVLIAHLALTRKISRVHLFSTVLVLVLGAITIVFRDATFLAWKPTVLNWVLAVICFGSLYLGRRPLLQVLMGKAVHLELAQWRQLTVAWSLFFVFVGAVNLLVYYSFSEQAWVYFKLWGLLGMTFLFVVLQAVWIGKVGTEPLTEADHAAE